jgi:hypothetical protein
MGNGEWAMGNGQWSMVNENLYQLHQLYQLVNLLTRQLINLSTINQSAAQKPFINSITFINFSTSLSTRQPVNSSTYQPVNY